MKKLVALLFLSLSTAAFAQTPVAETTTLSPAEKSIAAARKEITNKPAQYAGYNHLAIALSRRARETSDAIYYAQAEEALKKSMALAPADFESQKIRVWLLLGRHEFAAALEAAQALNKKVPDDVLVYGFLTDANAELGNYGEGGECGAVDAQPASGQSARHDPGRLPARIVWRCGGAYQLMDMAYQSTVPTETEDRAWILSQMGHLRFIDGKADDAENILQQVSIIFPKYHYALGNLAKVRIAQKRYDEAVALLQQRYDAAPHAENLYDLAEALELAGRTSDSKKAFADFEAKALAESSRKDNSSRELVFYYADHANRPAQALAIAEQEHAWRHDVYTLDAYGWALHTNGQDAEARKQLDAALAVGIRDAKLFAHAGEIALKLKDRVAAVRYLQQSVSLNATGSEQARALLARLGQREMGKQ